MKNTFFCGDCNSEFEALGTKKEWSDKIYGECWKWVADCPKCQKECGELMINTSSKRNIGFDTYVKDLKKQGGGCCGGGCCG